MRRYLLRLHGAQSEQVVRHVCRGALQEGQVVAVKGQGLWRVTVLSQPTYGTDLAALADCVPVDALVEGLAS